MFDTICHEHLEYYSSKVILNLAQNQLRVFDIKKIVLMEQASNIFCVTKNLILKLTKKQ